MSVSLARAAPRLYLRLASATRYDDLGDLDTKTERIEQEATKTRRIYGPSYTRVESAWPDATL
jgi:hypothetical protein